MKIETKVLVGVLGLAGLLSACRPAQKDPAFNMNVVRQETKVDQAQADALATLKMMGVPSLWQKTSGRGVDGNRVRIAMIGTGIDYNIPDLREALWINGGELGEKKWNNGQDDDENGFQDDVIGYDFYSGDSYPYDWHGQDTYVASVIAATGHANSKILGVAPNAELMILRYLSSDGGMNRDSLGLDAAIAFEYAIKNGAKVIYFNWPAGGFNSMQTDVLLMQMRDAEARNIVVVVPAGNSANQDVPKFLKEASQLKNVIVVGGLDADGRLAKFSNSGRNIVHLAAPVEAKGYYPGGIEARDLRSTSVAAGYVTGITALMLSLPNYASAARVKEVLMTGSVRAKNPNEALDVLSQGAVFVGNF